MKKSIFAFLALSMTACQLPINNLAEDKTIIKESVSTINKEIRSTQPNSQITKNFLSINKGTFKINNVTVEKNKISEIQKLSLNKSELKRKFIINISSENTKFSLNKVDISVNNKKLVDENGDEDISNISLLVDNFQEGDNIIDTSKLTDKNIKVDIIGFVDPFDIPRAVHSKFLIPNESKNDNNYIKGKVGIKFREGMKVRLDRLNGERKLKDETNISLTSLERFMKKYNVKSIANAIGQDVDSLNKDEVKAEELFGTDVPNQNLFYNLEVPQETDIYKLIEELKKLPFIEEAFPELIPTSPYTPNEYVLPSGSATGNTTSDNVSITRYKWLEKTHILPTSSDIGAWNITTGSPNVKVAVIDVGVQINSSSTPYIASTHQDLGNIQAIGNVHVPEPVYTATLDHGTPSAGIIGATGNNSIGVAGVAGVAHSAKTIAIHGLTTTTHKYSKCLGQDPSGLTSGCDGGADSVLLARRLGAKVIVLNVASVDNTAEDWPVARAAIVSAVADGVTICIPSNNNRNTNLIYMSDLVTPMPDTGSIVVGSLKHDGSSRMNSYNYGKSQKGGADNLYTIGGHGIDVSSSGQGLYTTFGSNNYNDYGASSGATPTVGGIVALMLSVKPDLNPLEIRKALRETASTTNTDNSNMPGMVNAFEAVNRFYPGFNPVTPTASGLAAKFYSSTIFAPEAIIDSLSNNINNQEFNIPYRRKTIYNVDFNNNLPDSFSSGLNYHYVADIQGMIEFTQTGAYQFAIYHDDGAILKIDGQTIISLQKNNSDGFSYGSVNITNTGKHGIQLLRNQTIGNANTVLWWQPPGGSFSVVPTSAFTRTTLNTDHNNTLRPGIIARFFENTTIPIDPTNYNKIYLGNLKYYYLNFSPSSGDAFGIGRSDNFAGYFSGFIKLPTGYSAGNYTLKVYHDDGTILYFNNQQIFSNMSTSINTGVYYLNTGINYPFAIHYREITGNSELRFAWVKPNGAEEMIPPNAFFH